MPAAHHHLDDETLNAVLDGEATEDQRADASRCPECSARLVRLGHVATALGAPVSPPDTHRRRAALDAALAAHDAGVAPPTPLHSRPHRRLSPAWVAAAAVVLAGALAVPLVDGLGEGDQGREAATAGGEREATSAGGSVAEEGALADQSARAEPFAALPHLGEIDLAGLDELAASIDDLASQDRAVASTPEAGRLPEQAGQACEQTARRNDPSLRQLAYAAEATVAGRPAVVLAFEVAPPGPQAERRLLVLARDNCTELGSASA